MKSVIYGFKRVCNAVQLTSAVSSAAIYRSTDDVTDRNGYTGAWIELVDANGKVIYRQDKLSLFTPLIEGEEDDSVAPVLFDDFSVLMPDFPRAAKIRVFAPALDETGNVPIFGKESVLWGEFEVPTPTLLNIGAEPVLPSDIVEKGRGRVLRKTLIKRGISIDAGRSLNFIILADKFGENQTPFINVALQCINYVYSRRPFNTAFGRQSTNVWLVEVESNRRNPSYFESTYASASLETRVNWNRDDVDTVCNALFSTEDPATGIRKPYWNWAGVIISERGRMLGTANTFRRQFAISTFSSPGIGRPWDVFFHEMGHAPFDLADEYTRSGSSHAKFNGAEPRRPNITIQTDRENLKWRNYVLPDTPIPTDERFGNSNPEKVGLFEGAGLYRRGIYRPQINCTMRVSSSGRLCRVCEDVASRMLSETISLFAPVPGIVHFSLVERKWDNLSVATGITSQFRNIRDFSEAQMDDLIYELRSKTVGDMVTNVMRRSRVLLPEETFILTTTEDGTDLRGIWYIIPPTRDVMYYISTFLSPTDRVVYSGKANLPPMLSLSKFDGVSIGLEYHIFCASDGRLSYGKIGESGVLSGEFTSQTVSGLGENISSISVDYRSSSTVIPVGVIDEGHLKLGLYSSIGMGWDEKGFIKFSECKDKCFEAVSVVQGDFHVYALVKSDDGVRLVAFDTVAMAWLSNTVLFVETEDVYQMDLSIYMNALFITLVTNDATITAIYDTMNKSVSCDSSEHESCACVSSLSTSVTDNTLHRLFMRNDEAVHEAFTINFDTVAERYELVYRETYNTDIFNNPQKGVSAFSLHSTPQLMYAVLTNAVAIID